MFLVDSCEQHSSIRTMAQSAEGNLHEPYSEPLQSCRPTALFGQQEWSLSLTHTSAKHCLCKGLTLSGLFFINMALWFPSPYSSVLFLFWRHKFGPFSTSFRQCKCSFSALLYVTSATRDSHPLLLKASHFRNMTGPWKRVTCSVWREPSSCAECFRDGESLGACPARCPRFPQPVLPSSAGRWLLCLPLPFDHTPRGSAPGQGARNISRPPSRAQDALLWTPEGCCESWPRRIVDSPSLKTFKNLSGRGPGQPAPACTAWAGGLD